MTADAVLITRPEPGARETAARVAAMGLTPIVAPVLAIRPLPLRLPQGTIAAILLPSGNAIETLPVSCCGLPVMAVGAATARRAQQAGFSRAVSADGDASALIALVRARIRTDAGTLLLASGRGQSLALAADLRASGYRVARRVAYAADPVIDLPEPARTALRDCPGGTVLLFSAATARHFAHLVRRADCLAALTRWEAITIGPPAAMALSDVPFARIRVAAKPTQDEMLALLQ
jgi:uroporphyrinogen-III synthase